MMTAAPVLPVVEHKRDGWQIATKPAVKPLKIMEQREVTKTDSVSPTTHKIPVITSIQEE
jgi:hypothetical protein